MKFAIALLVTSIAATSAFARSTLCLDAKLSFNSHASIACPAVTEICVKDLVTTKDAESAKSLVLVDGSKKTLEMPFSGYGKQHDSDIAAHLIYSFSKDGQSASYEVESDESYPYPTITGTFNRLTLSTGKKSNDNTAYYSQVCGYEVIK